MFSCRKCFILHQLVLLAVLSFHSGLPRAATDQSVPINELRAFSEAYYQIKLNYVNTVDDGELIRAAIEGMVASLDKHSKYLAQEEFKQFSHETQGEYAGIGLSFKSHAFGLEVVQVIDNSPASRAHILPEMIITHIDRQSIEAMPTDQAFSLLSGPEGEKVLLTVAAASFAQPKDIELQREIILLASVTSQRLPDDTAYIAISQFTLHSLDEFKKAYVELSKSKPVSRLILDLRDNPGGVMEVAVELSDLFINQGKLLISSGRSLDANQIYFANPAAPLGDLKVVVLMNKGSASASEIVAAALRDHKKAVILGERSYGKGSIQTIFRLNHDSGMKLTSAEYFSPAGSKIQDIGIEPDVLFEQQAPNPYDLSLLDDPQLLQAYNLLSANKTH